MFIYYTSNVLYSEIQLHKTFHQYNLYQFLWILLYFTIFHTALIYPGENSDTLTLIIDYGLTWGFADCRCSI